jgi:hypothetical protein
LQFSKAAYFFLIIIIDFSYVFFVYYFFQCDKCVPVIIPKAISPHLEYLVDPNRREEAGVHQKNDFVFAASVGELSISADFGICSFQKLWQKWKWKTFCKQ